MANWVTESHPHNLMVSVMHTYARTIKHTQSSSHGGKQSTDTEITKLHIMQTWMRKIRYRIRNMTQVKISTGMKVCSKVRPFLKPKIKLSQCIARKFLCVQDVRCTTDGQPKDSYWYTLSSCCPVFARALWRGNLSLTKSLTKCLKIQNPETGKKERSMDDCTISFVFHEAYIQTFNTKRAPHTISRFSVQFSLPFKQDGPLWQQGMII